MRVCFIRQVIFFIVLEQAARGSVASTPDNLDQLNEYRYCYFLQPLVFGNRPLLQVSLFRYLLCHSYSPSICILLY